MRSRFLVLAAAAVLAIAAFGNQLRAQSSGSGAFSGAGTSIGAGFNGMERRGSGADGTGAIGSGSSGSGSIGSGAAASGATGSPSSSSGGRTLLETNRCSLLSDPRASDDCEERQSSARSAARRGTNSNPKPIDDIGRQDPAPPAPDPAPGGFTYFE